MVALVFTGSTPAVYRVEKGFGLSFAASVPVGAFAIRIAIALWLMTLLGREPAPLRLHLVDLLQDDPRELH
jgi:hypothetical protein